MPSLLGCIIKHREKLYVYLYRHVLLVLRVHVDFCPNKLAYSISKTLLGHLIVTQQLKHFPN